MESALNFLRKIFDLLKSGEVFDVQNDGKKKIIDFKYPEEMKVRLSFRVTLKSRPGKDEPGTEMEFLRI